LTRKVYSTHIPLIFHSYSTHIPPIFHPYSTQPKIHPCSTHRNAHEWNIPSIFHSGIFQGYSRMEYSKDIPSGPPLPQGRAKMWNKFHSGIKYSEVEYSAVCRMIFAARCSKLWNIPHNVKTWNKLEYMWNIPLGI